MAGGKDITLSAVDGLTKGLQAREPYLVGGNSEEASFTRRGLNANERFNTITDKQHFQATFDPSKTNDADRKFARLIVDTSISEPDRALARFHSNPGFDTYIYHLSYVPISMREKSFGLAHGGEITCMFNTLRGGASFDDGGKAIAQAVNNCCSVCEDEQSRSR